MNNDWLTANDGPKWIPIIRQVEQSLGIPAGLLCRMAFQESSFRTDVVDGTHQSPAGALGILQLMPQYFTSTHASVPYDDYAVNTQIEDSGHYLVGLRNRFGSWSEALAAYNFGPGNEDKYLRRKIAELPDETKNYVAEILADVQLTGADA